MSIRNPMISNIVLSGRVASECKTREGEGWTISKITMDITQLSKKDGKWEREKFPMEVKGWNKTAEKLQKLAGGDLICVTGKLACDLFEYEGRPAKKYYIDAFQVQPLETKEERQEQPPQQQEAGDNPVQDDIPF